MYRTLSLILLIIFLGACARQTEPSPNLPQDPTQPLFTGADLQRAKPAKELKREWVQGTELDLEIKESEKAYEGTVSPSDLSPQAVLAGASGYVVYTRNSGSTWQIWKHDQATDAKTLVFSDTLSIDSVGINVTGNTVAASIFNSATNSNDVYVMDLTLATTFNLSNSTASETHVSVSALAGYTLGYIVWEGDNAGVRAPYVCAYFLNGNCSTTILSNALAQVQPSISSNGAYVTFVRELANGDDQVHLYNLATNTSINVYGTASELEHPSVSDDGLNVMYLRHDPTNEVVRVKNLATGITTNELVLALPRIVDHPHLTADGLFMTYGLENTATHQVATVARDLTTNVEATGASNSTQTHAGTYWQKPIISGSRIYVDKDATTGLSNGRSWVNAFIKLQDALNFLRTNPTLGITEVWVAAGVYYPDEGVFQTNNNESASFNLLDNLAISGGFDGVGAGGVGGTQETLLSQRLIATNLTILSGDIAQDDTNIDGNNIAEFTSHILGDNSDHVLYADSVEFATLDGFTVTAGQADGSVNTDPSYGGGFYTPGSSNLTFAAVTFYGNSAVTGGAMFNDNLDNATFTGVQFIENSSTSRGGAIYNIISDNHTYTDFSIFLNNSAGSSGGAIDNVGSSDHTYTNVDFLSNSAGSAGGALQNVTSSNNHSYTNVDFIGNSAGFGGGAIRMASSIDHSYSNVLFSVNSADFYGGAISNELASSINLDRATFVANSANEGGGIYNKDSSITVTNAMFSGNTAGRGAALYNYKSSSTASATALVRQVSFSRNAASISGGAMGLLGGANSTIQNSIFWGNTAPAGFGYNIYNDASFHSVARSDVQGAWNGVGVGLVNGGSSSNLGGNINANPRFIDANGADNINGTTDDNLRLGVNSPCLDTGSNAVASGSVDLDGNPRIVDGPDADATATIDMGAYERQ